MGISVSWRIQRIHISLKDESTGLAVLAVLYEGLANFAVKVLFEHVNRKDR
jgi:hypothetical protein